MPCPPKAPDFTVVWGGRTYYWEHLGMLDDEDYRQKWERKKVWYDAHYPNQLITTEDTATLSSETRQIVVSRFGVQPPDEHLD